ncbi:unnamed protein product [Musa acuminata subsp. burmannicoides]
MALTRIGLAGLAVMGQNLALNIAEKGFPISVYNRTTSKVDETVERAKREGNLPVYGFHDPASFVDSIQKPRVIIMLVKAGAPVDQTIATLSSHMEKGDCIIDGGNEWYENTERREKAMAELGLLYLGMGVSGGEEGARNGPSLMPGGSYEAYKYIEDILLKVAAQVPDSGPCVTYIGKGGSGNFVKMIHNGIEYGDMQLIAEAYDVLKSVGNLSNQELQQVFSEWNKGELLSFLIEITADIFGIKDDKGDGYLVDKVLDKTGMKGTGKWTVQQAAELSVAAPTIASSLDSRFLSGLKEERVRASKVFQSGGFSDILGGQPVDKAKLIEDVRQALYASKICSYAQGMNLIRAKSIEKGWDLKLGELARIWKGGCIIRAIFLDRIKKAYDRNPELPNLLVDPEFAKEIMDRQAAWRRVICLAINHGISTPGMSASLAYFDTYRRESVPANLVQAQRDYFGAHTYERPPETIVFRSRLPDITISNHLPLHTYCFEKLHETSDAPCLIAATTGKIYTFSETHLLCRKAAAGFSKLGIGHGDVIMVLLQNVPEFIFTFMGACMLGAITTTANPFCTPADIFKQIKASGAKLVVTQSAHVDKLRGGDEGFPKIGDGLMVITTDEPPEDCMNFWEVLDSNETAVPHVTIDPEDPVALPFSSGTTGLPKGVLLTHKSMVSSIAQQVDGENPNVYLKRDDVVLCVLPLFHIFALNSALLCSLRAGAATMLMPKFEIRTMLEGIQTHRVSVAAVVPPLVLALAKNQEIENYDLSSMRIILSGYLNDVDATSKTIDVDGWLHTGDIGYVDDDDEVFIVDRVKELIKYKGFQVPPAELESLLLSHPSIADAAVVPQKDEAAGEVPVAFVVRAKDSAISEQAIKEFIAKQVVFYKRLQKIYFVHSIPKSAAGKILRKELKAKLAVASK